MLHDGTQEKKIPGSQLGPFCLQFACSLHVFVGFLQLYRLLPRLYISRWCNKLKGHMGQMGLWYKSFIWKISISSGSCYADLGKARCHIVLTHSLSPQGRKKENWINWPARDGWYIGETLWTMPGHVRDAADGVWWCFWAPCGMNELGLCAKEWRQTFTVYFGPTL